MRGFLIGRGILTGLLGLWIGYLAIQRSKEIDKGKDLFIDIVKNSLLIGTSGSLLLLLIIIVAGVFDETQIWSIADIWKWLFISLGFGIFLTIGMTIQSLVDRAYKRALYRFLHKKLKNVDKEN